MCNLRRFDWPYDLPVAVFPIDSLLSVSPISFALPSQASSVADLATD